jgi:HTH-type transcriptional dual regulator CecR, C-terminal domain
MPAERALRSFIQAMFENLNDRDGEDQYTPTPGLAFVVDQIIAPRARLLSAIVARLTSDSARTLRTRLAAHSSMAQVVHYMHARPVIKILWPGWRMTAAARRQIVDHATSFSLAGLRGGAVPKRRQSKRRQRANRGAAGRARRK